MRKTQRVCSIVLFLMCFGLSAQDTSIINLQLGIGGSIQGTKIKTPALYGSYEYFVSERLSLGGLLGYSTLSFSTLDYGDDGAEETEEKTSNINIGGLVNYYFGTSDTLNLYMGGGFGYGSGLIGGFLYEMHAGARYALSDSLALNSELGFGASLLKLGVSFNID